MIVRHIVEISENDIMTYQTYYLTTMSNVFELRLCEISNPRRGLTPGTALCAIGSDITSAAKETRLATSPTHTMNI